MGTTVALAVVVSAAVAAALAGLGRALGGKIGGWILALAVGLGYAAGHLAIAWPAIPPVDVTDRIPWLALVAAVVAAPTTGRLTRWLVRSSLAGLTLGLMLGPVVGGSDTARVSAISGLVALVAWADVEVLAGRGEEPDVVRALLITAGGASVALVVAGSAVLGFLSVALTVAMAGGWVVVALGRGQVPSGWVTAAALVLTALVLEGVVYVSLPVPAALLLAVAPAMTWLTRLGPARRLGRWPALAIGTTVVLIPVAIAVAVAVAQSPSLES